MSETARAEEWRKVGASVVGAKATAGRPRSLGLEFDLLRDLERIVDLDTEIPNCALKLRMAEEQLNRSQIAGPLVDLRGLRPSHGVGSISQSVEADSRDLSVNDARVLAGRQAGSGVRATWK